LRAADAPDRCAAAHHAAPNAHHIHTQSTIDVHRLRVRFAGTLRADRARFTGMPPGGDTPHQLHAPDPQVGSILAFLARFLSKEATAWTV
jgi:hypothetical protein